MRVIIAGSRLIVRNGVPISLCDLVKLVGEAVNKSGFVPMTVISGGASGVDTAGEWWAKTHGIPVERYPAKWDLHGKRAGYLRNVQMAEKADALIAIWDEQSRGTKHMIKTARSYMLKVFVLSVL